MTARLEDPVTLATVQELISAYEEQSNLEPLHARQRTKSTGNVLSYKIFRQPDLDLHSIVDIEKELVKIEAHLNYYEIYEKETHVAFQEQLFQVLSCIVSIDNEGKESIIRKQTELIKSTQKLARALNARLPLESHQVQKGIRKTFSNIVRKQETVVSSTQEHTAAVSSVQNSNSESRSEKITNPSNGALPKKEEIDKEEKIEHPQVITNAKESPSSILPSVSKLRKFFSFRRDEREKIDVKPQSYSGLGRSRSLKISHAPRKEEIAQLEKSIRENGEPASKTSSVPENIISKDHALIRGDEKADLIHHNVSVSKLKSMFEVIEKDNEEGLGLLAESHTGFMSNINLPYNDVNLGVFRLKRTVSGSYMNFTGLLRNVDINKKSEISKSKSMVELKTNHQVDLSEELDDAKDFEVDDKETTVVNNNNTIEKNASDFSKRNNYTQQQSWSSDAETNLSAKVQQLRRNFEHQEHDVLHKTINPIEDVLKVPVQLRTGFILHNQDETDGTSDKEDEPDDYIATGTVVTLKQTFEQLGSSAVQSRPTQQAISKEQDREPASETSIYIKLRPADAESNHRDDTLNKVMDHGDSSFSVEALKQSSELEVSEKSLLSEPSVELSIPLEVEESSRDDSLNKEKDNEDTLVLSVSVEALKQRFELSRENSVTEKSLLSVPSIEISKNLEDQEPNRDNDDALDKEEENEHKIAVIAPSVSVEALTQSFELVREESVSEKSLLSVPSAELNLVENSPENDSVLEDQEPNKDKALATEKNDVEMSSVSVKEINQNFELARQESVSQKLLLPVQSIELRIEENSAKCDTNNDDKESEDSASTIEKSFDHEIAADDCFDAALQNTSTESNVVVEEPNDDASELKVSTSLNLNITQENIIDEVLNGSDLENIDEAFESILDEGVN